VLAHYKNDSEAEQLADIEAARRAKGFTLMAISTRLVPGVRALLKQRKSA
jgi:hypothetical protein